MTNVLQINHRKKFIVGVQQIELFVFVQHHIIMWRGMQGGNTHTFDEVTDIQIYKVDTDIQYNTAQKGLGNKKYLHQKYFSINNVGPL